MKDNRMEMTYKIMIVVIISIVLVFAIAFTIFVVGSVNAKKAAREPFTEYIVINISGDHEVNLRGRNGQKMSILVENAHDESFTPGTVFIMPKTIQP